MKSTSSQRRQIAAHLSAGNALTALEALRLFGVNRLAARVLDLRHDGVNVVTTMVEVEGANGPARVAKYSLGEAVK